MALRSLRLHHNISHVTYSLLPVYHLHFDDGDDDDDDCDDDDDVMKWRILF